ncbi:tryptophan 7-halogenase [Massilia sp. PAMC28688]|uniref:tryptophan halogenase family protein n=1 Tax=Massilia sp. PAMC28688 TaxID=2861283 RepID=UPI001C62F5C8|nr:tryptophan halogenase family protein [Massilia sp. PAMC28688]QYF92602.1 tryptophan 7-halogenase [Massilia sp. PAMC28688]
MKSFHNVLIVGGGTAGWLTAAFLAKTLGARGEGIRFTLLESPEIGTVGVGEGTFPSIRGTLAAIGLDEATFVRECQATFKQGVRFDHWVRAPGTPGPDHYFHPFSHPSQRPGCPELLPYWLRGVGGHGVPFAQAVTMQKRVADLGRGPKRPGDPDFAGPMNYAYHFDAGRFATLLASHGRALGVRHVLGNVEQVELDELGAIARVRTREHGALSADLYIDCTGFRARLIGQALGSPLRRLDDVLFADRALAIQVPYADPAAPIAAYTISTAHEAGWSWDIGLQQRRGVGYVYSSRHTSDERAAEVLRRHIGPAGAGLEARQLTLQTGYRETQWIHNCVAVGLSGGFLEPLEASGIGMIETAAYLIGYLFPFNGDTAPVARTFNRLMRERYERVMDFIKLHYCLTQRTDSRFWIDNTDPASMPASLRDKLAMWRARPPNRLDFVADVEMYPTSSWQYVLYGMEFDTRLHASAGDEARRKDAAREFCAIAELAQHAAADLPSHRALVEHFCSRNVGR